MAKRSFRLANDTAAQENGWLRKLHPTIPIKTVAAVLTEQIDGVVAESLEQGPGDLIDVLRSTIQASYASLCLGINFPSELGGDHDLPMEGSGSVRPRVLR